MKTGGSWETWEEGGRRQVVTGITCHILDAQMPTLIINYFFCNIVGMFEAYTSFYLLSVMLWGVNF